MRFRRMPARKLRGLAAMFFGAGGLGIGVGLWHAQFYVTTLGTVFICIGGLAGYMLLSGRAAGARRR